MRSGEVYRGRTDFPRGDPENPVDDEVLASKFLRLMKGSWDEPRPGDVCRAVLNLEDVPDVAALF